jgi:hypothetical protein
MNSPFKFPRRVRIHGGDSGAVARALHHVAYTKSLTSYRRASRSLISDEKAFSCASAELETASSSTIERKQMSTKTTLKRIALVAVSALGFGVLTALAPASAAPNTNLACTISYDAPAATNIPIGNQTSNGVTHTYTVASHAFIVGQYVTITGTGVAGLNLTNALVSSVSSTSITVTPTGLDVAAAAGTVASSAVGSIALGTENKTCKGLVGAANTVTIASTQATVKEYVVVSGGTFTDGTTAKVLGTGSAVSSAGILTPTAGTITVVGYSETAAGSGIYNATATDSLSIVVQSAPVGSVYSSSKVTVVAGSNASARTVVNLDAVKSYYSSASLSLSASSFDFTVTQRDAALATVSGAVAKAVTATVSGVGTLSIGDGVTTAQGGYVAQAAGTALAPQDATATVRLYADGRAGTSTVTISVDGTAVATYSVTFYGSAASYSVTTNANYIATGANAGVFTVVALDANGVKVPSRTILATSSSTATATVDPTITSAAFTCVDVNACTSTEFSAMGKASFAVTGVAAGAVTITFANAATSPTITSTGQTNISSGQIASLAWAFDKSSYTPGAEMAILFTMKDSAGNPVADGTYTIFSAAGTAASKSAPGYATVSGLTVDVVDGIGEWDFYAPTDSGDFKVSATLASNASLAAALRGQAVSISTSVSGGAAQAAADLAADAAAEAIDAANAATDAANLAAEAADAATVAAEEARDAADAATAAVEELATQVATLMAALKAQITTLANTVAKIAKKVRA